MTPSPDLLVSQLVGALSGVLARLAEPDAVLAVLLQQAVSLTDARRGVLAEVSPNGALRFSVLHSYRQDLLGDPGYFSHGVFQRCLSTGQDVILRNACSDLPIDLRRTAVEYRIVAVLCMPVRVGTRIGALLHLEHSSPGHFDDSHVRLLRPLLDLASPVLEALAAGRAVLGERERLVETQSQLLEEATESRVLLAREWSFGRFVGRTAAVRDLESTVRRAAASPYPVLLTGETGTGKSILARIIHSASARAKQPFVTVFCPALERSMIEAELFGSRRGAYTGAYTDRSGKVQHAEGGSLFLDEIAELPLELQPKLLRLLQERTYERIGDPDERTADVRVIAATNRHIEAEVRAGRFRRDLFERLNYVPIRVPPLREHREDIPDIFRHCLDHTPAGRWMELTADAVRYLQAAELQWPGNVRHLEQLPARLSLEPPSRTIGAADVERLLGIVEASTTEPAIPRPEPAPPASARSSETELAAALERAERSHLKAMLERYPGATRTQLAKMLGISESSLFRKLRHHGLD